jgi:hypothetical protein
VGFGVVGVRRRSRDLLAVSDDDLVEAIARLRSVERDVSTERRALHSVLDRIEFRLGEVLKTA